MDRDAPQSQEALSLKLYQYLCNEVVGSENVVKSRRLYYKVFDDIHTSKVECCTYISSGSRAEGLHLPGSDLDVMCCLDKFRVIDPKNTNIVRNKNVFIMESDNTLPGFVHIVRHPSIKPCYLCDLHVQTDYGNLLSNREFKYLQRTAFVQKKDFVIHRFTNIHGPCLSSEDETFDFAYCLRCDTWPYVARYWLLRNRLHWPPTELIYAIASHGVLLVPIGSKSTGEDNPLEWRMSFSEPEKLLIYSFNNTQLLCYTLLKLVLKQVINNEEGVKNLLCSYYIKTAMFWLSEEVDIKRWKPSNLLDCFWNCIQRLLYWVRCNYLPNYFIPEHNMIDGKIDERDRVKLVLALERLQNMGLKTITQCESLREFLESDASNITRALSSQSLDYYKTIITMILEKGLSCYRDFYVEDNGLIEEKLVNCLRRFSNKQLITKNYKNLYGYYAAFYSLQMAIRHDYIDRMQSHAKTNNKLVYRRYRKCLQYLLIGTNADAAFGWVMLSILFYSTNQHFKALEVLEYTSSVFSLHKMSSVISLRNVREMNAQFNGYSFFKRLRTEVMHSYITLHKLSDTNSFFFHGDIGTLFEKGWYIRGSSSVLTYFLRFFCYRHLNNYAECVKSQQSLKHAINDGHLDDVDIRLATAYLHLMKASGEVYDKETVFDCVRKLQSLPCVKTGYR